MKPFLLFAAAVFLFGSCSNRALTNRYRLTQLVPESENHKVKKILIVGNGGTGTRFFLDNLSEVLIQELKQYGVQSSYEFLGYKEGLEKCLNILLLQGDYDAVLQFTPTSETEDPIVYSDYTIPLQYGGINVKTSAVRFTQNFIISLFTKGDATTIWKAALQTNLDSRDSRFYTALTNDIVRCCSAIIK